MDEQRRRAYLRAMGVDLWVPRRGAVGVPPSTLPAAAPVEIRLAGSRDELALPPTIEPIDPSPAAPPPGLSLPGLIPDAGHPEAMGWEELAAAVAACRACGLWETRTQTVFGVGDREADLLVIGEAPGADEDREGEPFVGRAGRLLNQMLGAIGLPRDRVYIANILKCRPPGNRDPRPDEVLRCQGYLQRQLALIRPRVILSVGRVSAQSLLATDTPVGRLRGRWLAYGPDSIPLRVTYHPAYLLRTPDQKSKAWEDLTHVARRLREEPQGSRDG